MNSLEKCQVYSRQSKAEIKFGAFLERNGQVISIGCNKRPTGLDKYFFEKLLGKKLDYCIHAEEMALLNALRNNESLLGTKLYVAGFSENKVIKRDRPFFTCKRCAERVLIAYDIPVLVYTESGWQELSPKEALKTAMEFRGKNFWKTIAKEMKKSKWKSEVG